MMALMVAILNIFASSLVYVRILPLDKQVDKVGSSGEKTQIKGTDTKFDKSKENYFTFTYYSRVHNSPPFGLFMK